MKVTSNLADLKPKKLARQHSHKRVKIVHNGVPYTLDSKREYEVYQELALLEKAGEIRGLEIHKRFELIPKNKDFRGISYECDFYYQDSYWSGRQRNWIEWVVLDVKGLHTEIFKLKQKMFRHVYGYCIRVMK